MYGSTQYLASARDLDGALRTAAALHEVPPLPGLVHQREPVERADHTAVTRIHNALRRVALACIPWLPSLCLNLSVHSAPLQKETLCT